MITEESSIENESKVSMSTYYHQLIEIQNTKSRSRAEKSNSQSVRPTVSITENYNNVKVENLVVTAPANKSYSRTTKYGKKRYVVVHNHITQI